MYNKIFTKILDSSIWLESNATRIVWMTFLAAMDEDGMCQFASVANIAHRARVELDEAKEAIRCLEAPDENSSDPDNDGRRIERVPGGWIVLNATKYREIVTRVSAKEKNRERVARHREKKKDVMECNGSVMQSEARAETESEAKAADQLFSLEDEKDASLSEMRKEVVKEWNNLNLSQVVALSTGRVGHLNARLRETWWKENWKKALNLIPSSPFLTGKIEGRNGGKPFKITFDFFIRPDTVAKIIEGTYHGNETPSLPSTGEKKRVTAADHIALMEAQYGG